MSLQIFLPLRANNTSTTNHFCDRNTIHRQPHSFGAKNVVCVFFFSLFFLLIFMKCDTDGITGNKKSLEFHSEMLGQRLKFCECEFQLQKAMKQSSIGSLALATAITI